MPFQINMYPSKTKPDPVRPVYPPLVYYPPKTYPLASRYSTQSCIRADHNFHPNNFIPQSFEYSRAKELHSTVPHRWLAPEPGDQYYAVTANTENRLDRIAAIFYNSPTFWWVIADANPKIMFNIFEVPNGTVLRIPSVRSLYGSGGVLNG